MAIEYVFAGIAVTDHNRAVRWYARLFGRAADVLVRDDVESMWQLKDAAWIYVLQDAERAGKSFVTILVEDLENHVAEIARRGIGDWETELLPGVYKKAIFTDADGNTVAFGETY